MAEESRMNPFYFLVAIISLFASRLSSADPCSTAPASENTAAAKLGAPLACNLLALTAEERKRHFEIVGPALRRLRTGVRELPNGYEFQYPSDAKTVALLNEWVARERRCCRFFEMDVRVDAKPLSLRLTGRQGTKEFIRMGEWINR
jgi:hypothetical protein